MYKPAVCWRTLEDAKVATVRAKAFEDQFCLSFYTAASPASANLLALNTTRSYYLWKFLLHSISRAEPCALRKYSQIVF